MVFLAKKRFDQLTNKNWWILALDRIIRSSDRFLGVWPNSLFSLSIKWKVWNNSIKWLVKFRSSEKWQFRSSEIRSSDRLPTKHIDFFHNSYKINFKMRECYISWLTNFSFYDMTNANTIKGNFSNTLQFMQFICLLLSDTQGDHIKRCLLYQL